MRRGLLPERVSTRNKAQRKPKPEVTNPVETAIRFLGSRRRFERDVVTHLRKKGVTSADIEATIARLKELQLLDDAETARAWLTDRVRFGAKGRLVLRAELLRKGVSAAIVEEALGNLSEEVPEVETAARLATKIRSRGGRLTEEELRRKIYGALARRGFDQTTVREAMARALGDGVNGEGDLE